MKKSILCLVLSVFMSTKGYAACVDTFGIGPKATALGGAVTAQSNDVFSIYYNPAALTELKGGQFSMALQMADPNLKFHNYTVERGTSGGTSLPDIGGYGTNIHDESDNLFIPFIGYAQPITENLAMGIALYVPYGLDIKWSDDVASNPAAMNCFHSYYIRETITPNLSYKINDQYAIGIGVSLGRSLAGVERYFISTAFKAKVELEDDCNYSINFGFKYTPADNVAIGISYRGRAKADFDGDVELNGTKVTDASLSYDHPEQIQVGVMVKPITDITLEMDVVWTRWSINKTQDVIFSESLLGLIPGESFERDWNDTNQIRIGAEWQVNQMWVLRCGYFYDPSPIPDDTFDIIWPDADRKTYSIGTGLNLGKWTIDASFQFAIAETMRIIGGESDNLNASYNSAISGIDGYTAGAQADGHLLGYGLAVTYNF